jgi:hypothetical protein
VLVVLFLFLASEIFAGPLRYYLARLGVAWLVYAPKLLVLVILLGQVIEILIGEQKRTMARTAFTVFAAYLVIGAYFTRSLAQAAFGGFVFLPLAYAVAAGPALRRYGERIVPYAAFLWLCVGSGILIDLLADTPWSGRTYELAGAEIVASIDWETFGWERVAGFARASYSAATQALFLALVIVVLGRSTALKLLVWAVTGVLTALTTTKTTVGAYALLTLIVPLMTLQTLPRKLEDICSTALPIVIAAIGITLPATVLFIEYDTRNWAASLLFSSFGLRLTEVWPQTFDLVARHGSILLGRGIGGIGTAQGFFEPHLRTPGDNMYLFLYATFGLPALVVIAAYVARIARLRPRSSRWEAFTWLVAISALAIGWTTNCVEGVFIATALGHSLAHPPGDGHAEDGTQTRDSSPPTPPD